MQTLSNLLSTMKTYELVNWAMSIDPNSAWDEAVEFDSSITADQLRAALLVAYSDDNIEAWINSIDVASN